MKKTIALALLLVMVLSLCMSCASAETAGLKVALCVAETLGDLGFYDSANEGLKALEADYGVVGSVVECKSDASMYQVALVEAAETNDIVVAVGWQFWDGLCVVVPEMPETKFIFVDNGLDGVGDNLLSIVYAENEGSFLAGYVAMKLSENSTVGVIGGENSETINVRNAVERIFAEKGINSTVSFFFFRILISLLFSIILFKGKKTSQASVCRS